MCKPLTIAETIAVLQTFDQEAYVMLSRGFEDESCYCDGPFTKDSVMLGTVIHYGSFKMPVKWGPGYPDQPGGWALMKDKPEKAPILEQFPALIWSAQTAD